MIDMVTRRLDQCRARMDRPISRLRCRLKDTTIMEGSTRLGMTATVNRRSHRDMGKDTDKDLRETTMLRHLLLTTVKARGLLHKDITIGHRFQTTSDRRPRLRRHRETAMTATAFGRSSCKWTRIGQVN